MISLGNIMSRTLREVTDALKALGAVQVRQIRLPESERLRPWAWRNVDQWTDATPETIRKALLRPAA
jgi:hypothetical protein